MYEAMIQKLDEIYQLQRKKFEEIDAIHFNPHYTYFGKLGKQNQNIKAVKLKYNNHMSVLYQEVNEFREKLELKPLTNPYKERN